MNISALVARSVPLVLLASGTVRAFPTDDTQAPTLEEITVTAQRRSESLQTVPIAITALSAAEMERNGIHELGSLSGQVPGLTFSPFAAGQNIIAMRGVSSNDDGAGTDNSVAVFVDDVYAGRVSNINPEMFDIDRVEVLRGPQGTLYGKNTIGGAINIVSSRPRTDALDVEANADVGNYERHNFSGLVTGPLGEGWAGKFVVSSRKADGWVRNVALNTREKDDDAQSLRGQLLGTGEHFELLLSADASRIEDADMARTPLTNVTGNLGDLRGAYESLCGPEPNPSCATNPYGGYQHQIAHGASAKLTAHLTSATDFISITAWHRAYNQWSMDSLGAVIPLGNNVWDNTKEVTQEMRLVSTPADHIRYVTGIWLSREDTNRLRLFQLGTNSMFNPPISTDPNDMDRYRGINRTISAAVFGQVDWHFADHWTVTGGGRYSYDHKHMDNDAFHGPSGIFEIIPFTFSNQVEAGWSKFTPKVSLSYQPSEALNSYVTAAEGFKSGGFAASPTSVAETAPLRPEVADSIEVGAKLEIARRVRANLAIFDTHYKDLQIQAFGPPPGCAPPCFGVFETFNAGGARAKGAELEITWLPIDDLTLTASYGFLDAKFTSVFLPNASVYAALDGTHYDLRSQSGQDMLRAPRHKGSIEARYAFSLSSRGRLEASANYTYTGDQRGELEPYAIQPAFGLIGARLGWLSTTDEFEVSLWGRNLANKAWINHVYTIANEVFGAYGAPRTYGVTVAWHLHP
jgi:iron complex outermembrane receptor protein